MGDPIPAKTRSPLLAAALRAVGETVFSVALHRFAEGNPARKLALRLAGGTSALMLGTAILAREWKTWKVSRAAQALIDIDARLRNAEGEAVEPEPPA
jgi:hypothetical protein